MRKEKLIRQSAVFRVASVENRENNSSKILDGEGFSVEEKEDSSTANARRIPDKRIWRESLRLTRVKADGFYQSYAAFLVICRRKQSEDPNRRRNSLRSYLWTGVELMTNS